MTGLNHSKAVNAKAVIFSASKTYLTDREKGFFSEAKPFGFILFARNCETPEQVKTLTNDLRKSVGWHCPVLIDQEGGRVQRLKPPIWRQYPSAKTLGDQADENHSLPDQPSLNQTSSPHRSDNLHQSLESIRFISMQIAQDLGDCGINVNCAPVIDVLAPQTHDAIGDRAFSSDPDIVAKLGLSVCQNYLAAGITPVIKHLPGHGRATQDSHHDLPVVSATREKLEQTDFLPFRKITASDIAPAIWGMASHIIYNDIDPDHPASVSAKVINEIIRESIGFNGLLLSDDLDMKALSAYGDVASRCRATIKSGCDVALYCSGRLKDMEKIAESVPKLSISALERLQKASEFTKVAA